jgi:Flp pilus assembly protein TadD
MRTPNERTTAARSRRRTGILTAALIASACSSPGSMHFAQVEERNESGFTITEQVRASASVREDFETAIRLIEAQAYERGIALLIEVTAAAPLVTAAHIDLGIAYGQVDDLERAESSLERALELNPRHPVAHNEMGILYRKTGRFEDARDSYQNALATHPEFHFARRNLAVLCDMYLSDPECALEHYEIYTQAVPNDEATAIWIADLRNRIGE